MKPTVVDGSQVWVTATFPLTHLCPFRDEVDEGEVQVSWGPGDTLELHSLRAWLATFADERISHEVLTKRIRDELAGLVTGVRVLTRWETAGGTVAVSA